MRENGGGMETQARRPAFRSTKIGHRVEGGRVKSGRAVLQTLTRMAGFKLHSNSYLILLREAQGVVTRLGLTHKPITHARMHRVMCQIRIIPRTKNHIAYNIDPGPCRCY